MKKKNRGINPVIATILLIVIAIVAAVVLYGFSLGLIGGLTKTQQIAGGAIMIDGVSVADTLDSVDVYYRNVGGSSIEVVGAYVLDTTGNIEWTASIDPLGTGEGEILEPGQSTQSTVTGPTGLENLDANSYYQVKIVAADGSSTVTSFRTT